MWVFFRSHCGARLLLGCIFSLGFFQGRMYRMAIDEWLYWGRRKAAGVEGNSARGPDLFPGAWGLRNLVLQSRGWSWCGLSEGGLRWSPFMVLKAGVVDCLLPSNIWKALASPWPGEWLGEHGPFKSCGLKCSLFFCLLGPTILYCLIAPAWSFVGGGDDNVEW